MAGTGTASAVIEKPQTDHREYVAVTLDNGLQAVVISDSKCDKAAAALSVKTGTLFDPKECQGLAHFCEHMLFLGTEKYPKEDEYNEFLAKHGGMSNAYTADMVTNYFFGVSPDHLDGALDRFSQFFISPLFTESATDRELQAVDSEHSKNQQSDAWRAQQLLKSDANPRHPLCSFGTGNTETLKEIPEREGFPVRKHLLDFHAKHYSANLMCVSVLGKESSEELLEMVRSKFGPVVNKNAPCPEGPSVGNGEPAFACESWPRLVRVIPVKDMRAVTFQFVLPQQTPMNWRTKPTRCLSFLLGHEGKGSVLSCLKARGVATELMAGPALDDAGACIFAVTVHTTEEGEKEVQFIGEALFAYIRLLQEVPLSKELWKEITCVEQMNFRFRSVGNPISTVSNLTHAMQDHLPIDKVLSGPAKVWDFDADGMLATAQDLKCAKLRCVLSMKSHTEAEHCPDTERWYGTRYGATPLPEQWHKAWEGRRMGDGGAAAAVKAAAELGLALPMPNPFVAEDLELKAKPEGGVPAHPARVAPLPAELGRCLRSCPAAPASPLQLLQVYFRQDDQFDLPKACLNVDIYCPWTFESLRNRILTTAWCHALGEELNEFAYDAEVAGLVYGLSPMSRGLALRITGYQHKLPILLRKVAEKMAAMTTVSEHTWNLVHTTMLRNFTNAATTKQPYQQCSEWEQRSLSRTSTTSQELLEAFKAIKREDLDGVDKQLLGCCYAEALLQGNVDEEPGLSEVMEGLLPALRPKAVPAAVPALAVGLLPDGPGSTVLIRRTGTNPKEQNGAVVLTLQAAEETMENLTLAELAAQVLSQRCFDELRTKQQLGYIVALQPYADGVGTGSCGLKVIVQSEKHPAEVHRRIDAWLGEALKALTDEAALTDEQLTTYLEALLAQKREKPKKLSDEFGRNWNQVSQRQFNFERRDQVIAFLERPRGEVLPMFRSFVRSSLVEAPRIATEVLGSVAADKGGDEAAPYEGASVVLQSLEEVEAFRKRLTWRESNTEIKC